MDYWLLVLSGIASWRITKLLWNERGPLDILVRIRARIAARQKRAGGLYDMVSCFNCLSVWVSAIFALFIATNIFTFIICLFIISGIAIIIQELITNIKK